MHGVLGGGFKLGHTRRVMDDYKLSECMATYLTARLLLAMLLLCRI